MKTGERQEQKLLSRKAAAFSLSISIRKLDRLLQGNGRNGSIRSISVGRRRMVVAESIDQFIKQGGVK